MSQLNKQDAYLHWAWSRPKQTYPLKPTCKSCVHWEPMYPEGSYTEPEGLCLLGKRDEYKDYHVLGDYLESLGKDPEKDMAALCPHYSNVILELKSHTLHKEVFGFEDIPPLTAQNWGGHPKQEKVQVPISLTQPEEKKSWPKKTAALVVLTIGLLGAVTCGIIQEVKGPTQYTPQVERSK